MALSSLANLAISAVATAPSPATSGTSLTVATGQGSRFPSSGSFPVVIWPTATNPDPTNAEIALCTAVSGDVLTITRAQEGTSARTIVVGDQVMMTITKAVLDGMATNVQVFSSSGTWTKPVGAKWIHVKVFDGGSGGGSGRRGAAGTVRYGGSGGSGGAWCEAFLAATNVDASCTVSVGAGGTGGAAQTVDSTNGNPGTTGGISSFQWNSASNLRISNRNGQGGSSSTAGVGGTATGANGQSSTSTWVMYQGLPSGSGSLNGGSSGNPGDPVVAIGSGGGAGGDGIDAANTIYSGASDSGRSSYHYYNGSSNGGAGTTTSGANGGTPAAVLGLPGRGGGGGKPQSAGAGGSGGDGSIPGGGGGGGAASPNGFASGAGGKGGDGQVIVTTYF